MPYVPAVGVLKRNSCRYQRGDVGLLIVLGFGGETRRPPRVQDAAGGGTDENKVAPVGAVRKANDTEKTYSHSSAGKVN